MEYIPVTPENLISVDRLYTVHYFEYARGYSFYGEKHDFWELVYVDRGEVGILADTRCYVLRQGDIVFHKPYEYHNIWALNSFANSIIISFSASGKDMDFLKNKIMHLDKNDRILLSKIIHEAEHCFNEPLNIVELNTMTKKDTAPFGSEQLIRVYLEELLIGIVRKNNTAQITRPSTERAAEEGRQMIVDTIITYLNEHISDSVTLDDVVEAICFSKTYIKTLFKEKTGTTIVKYLTNLRIDKAKRLISEGKMTFSEIAAACGFASVHYFSNTFKKITEMTPTEYSMSVKSKGIL